MPPERMSEVMSKPLLPSVDGPYATDPIASLPVGCWVKVRGRLNQDGAFVARDITSIRGAGRERLKLIGEIESVNGPDGVLTVMGISLGLTAATEIEDDKGEGLSVEDLSVSQLVAVYAKRSDATGAWTATTVRLSDGEKKKWDVEGVIGASEQIEPGVHALDVGPLKVSVDRYTFIADCEHRPARVVPFDRRTWGNGRRELIWHSPIDSASGYGSAARQLLLAVERQGIDIAMLPTRRRPAQGFERLHRPSVDWGKIGFYCDWRLHPSVLNCERIVNYSMWESTQVPSDHVDEINQVATLQYVPCQQNLESFRESGVRVPIKILHCGVDAERFPYLEREPSEDFTFGTFGDLHARKGIDVLIRAFRDEFRTEEPVRLVMKSTSPMDAYRTGDARVTCVSGNLDQEALLELLRQMDAFVMPSRGEGFGLCGLEAMSTGLPLIATNWSGPVEYLDPADSFPLSYRLVDADGTRSHNVTYYGHWAEPDYEHLRHLMRWLYEHREEAAQMGRRAAGRVRERWTWDRVAKQFVEDLDAMVIA
jgi:glycosyltransferase involved in cell wall biosynthesis